MAKPIFRLVSKASKYRSDFGGQNELIDMLNGMRDRGYETQFASFFGSFVVHSAFSKRIPGTIVLENVQQMLSPCDVFMMFVGSQSKIFGSELCEVFEHIPSGAKKVMSLNNRPGDVANPDKAAWSREFDLYIFENNSYKDRFLASVPGANAIMLHTCVDIEPFLKVTPKFEEPMHVVRLVSRPKTKIPRNTDELMCEIRKHISNCEFSYMSYKEWIMDAPWVHKFVRDEIPVTDFLARGNCFWHPLPPGVGEPGPRVIVEAMAAGLPVICTGSDGPKDRVSEESGWWVATLAEIPPLFEHITIDTLRRKGEAARQRALDECGTWTWLDAIIDK